MNSYAEKEILKEFEKCFTHKSFSSTDNYEMYELLGDVTANKCVVSYLKQRFPFLNSSKDVKCMARLRINPGIQRIPF